MVLDHHLVVKFLCWLLFLDLFEHGFDVIFEFVLSISYLLIKWFRNHPVKRIAEGVAQIKRRDHHWFLGSPILFIVDLDWGLADRCIRALFRLVRDPVISITVLARQLVQLVFKVSGWSESIKRNLILSEIHHSFKVLRVIQVRFVDFLVYLIVTELQDWWLTAVDSRHVSAIDILSDLFHFLRLQKHTFPGFDKQFTLLIWARVVGAKQTLLAKFNGLEQIVGCRPRGHLHLVSDLQPVLLNQLVVLLLDLFVLPALVLVVCHHPLESRLNLPHL